MSGRGIQAQMPLKTTAQQGPSIMAQKTAFLTYERAEISKSLIISITPALYNKYMHTIKK